MLKVHLCTILRSSAPQQQQIGACSTRGACFHLCYTVRFLLIVQVIRWLGEGQSSTLLFLVHKLQPGEPSHCTLGPRLYPDCPSSNPPSSLTGSCCDSTFNFSSHQCNQPLKSISARQFVLQIKQDHLYYFKSFLMPLFFLPYPLEHTVC
jgi:hypothetical protein